MKNLESGGVNADVAQAPAPLVPQEVDLTSFPWAPVRLDFLTDTPLALLPCPEPYRASLLLVARAWRQRPAMSVPDDDAQLAAMAGFGRDIAAWLAIRADVLRDWVQCSDGRFYHREGAPWALQAWESKKGAERFSALQRERALMGVARRQSGTMAPAKPEDVSRGSAPAGPYKKEEDNEKILEGEERNGEKLAATPPPLRSLVKKPGDASGGSQEVTQSVGGDDVIVQIFEHWKRCTQRPGATLTHSRRLIIQARLDEGVTSDEILRAIDAAATSDFYQGRTAKQPQRIDTLDVICRNADRIQRLAGEHSLPAQSRKLKPAAQKTAESIKSMLARLQPEVSDVDTPSALAPARDQA